MLHDALRGLIQRGGRHDLMNAGINLRQRKHFHETHWTQILAAIPTV